MSILNGTLRMGRRSAEGRMTDTIACGLFYDATDETTGDATRTLATPRYTGIARIKWGSREVTNLNGVSSPVAVQEPFLSIPFGSPRLHVNDEVQITGTEDPILIGRSFRVAGAPQAGQTTAHRYPLEELP